MVYAIVCVLNVWDCFLSGAWLGGQLAEEQYCVASKLGLCTAVLCRLTDLEITENILLLLLAGHDTSSTTLTRLLSVLHDTPEVVQQLRQEQAAVLARHGEQLTAAAIKDMEYADAVIR